MQKKNQQSISDSVLQSIEEQQLQPSSKWSFLLKDGVVWISAGVVILFGALSVAITIAVYEHADIALVARTVESPVFLVARLLPVFWVVMLIVFMAIAEFNLRSTKYGYRFHWLSMSLWLIAISLVGGVVLHVVGIGERIDTAFEEGVPVYSQYLVPHHKQWTAPTAGVLSGVIIEYDATLEPALIQIETLDAEEWMVLVTDDTEYVGSDLQEGIALRLVGEVVEEDVFAAEVVRVLPKDRPYGPKKGDRFRAKMMNERK